jgi:hypothetical protein
MQRAPFVALLILAGTATSAPAQEWLVHRDQFRYVGTRLTIDVTAEAAGRLQILRGEPGIVRVAGRVPVGFAAAGLSDDDHLTLTAAGAGPVHFMVVVPDRVWITVRLPDRTRSESVGGHARSRAFEWRGAATSDLPAAAAAPMSPFPEELSEASGALGPGLFTTYSADIAPATVALPDLRAVRTITVRTGGDRFRIATSRPLGMEPGSPRALEIRPSGEPMDIVIEIPAGTADFALSAHGASALTVRRDVVTPGCAPFTRQWLSDGREWVTFSPVQGSLDCPRIETSRHKG